MKRRQAMALVLGAGALPACGYALVGRGTVVDPTIKRIGVPLFKDATGKPGLDQKVTQRVIEELLKRGRFDVVQQADGVDALVTGELASYNARPVGFEAATTEPGQPPSSQPGSQTQASRYAITLTAKVRYQKKGAPEPIWANDNFSFRDEYDLGTDANTFFDREEQAIDRVAIAFARSLVAAMLEAF